MTTLSTAHFVLLEIWLLLPFCAYGSTDVLSAEVCKTCHQNATCIEKDNKYFCMCNFGLIGNGRTQCVDKDECQGTHKICGEHTTCHNTHGSYYCICLKGYRPSNNHENFIPNDGTFCTDVDECEDSDICGVNGKCKNIPGNYECYCNDGFSLQNGTGPFQANGDKSLCKEIDCGQPPSGPNSATIVSAKTTFGSQVTYKCLSGFNPDQGVSTSICTAKGTWEGATVMCTEIDECDVPKTCGINALCRNIPGSFECFCKEGYRPQNGKNTFQSKDIKFICQAVDCGQPPALPNTEMVLAGATTFGAQVTYMCISGFLEEGHNTSVCTSNGTWEGVSLACTAIDCGPPVAMLNTIVHTFTGTTFGSIVTFMCATGFIAINGYNLSICNHAGSWEGANLDCRVVDCGPPPAINNTKPDILWNTTYGNTVSFECTPGFVEYSGNKTAVCNEKGKWVGSSIVCREIDCGQPPLLPNAEIKWNGDANLGSEVRYTCQKGFYNPKIWHVSRCTSNETWENITFSCTEVDCGMPFLIEHADWIWNNQTTLRSHVYYKCRSGFTDNGKKNFSVCLENATWDVPNMKCSVKEDLISNLIIFNETCLQWYKSSDIFGWEIFYKFSIHGIRWNDKNFVDKKSLNYTTDNENPAVCFDLLPDANYTVSMVATSATLPAILLNITVKTTTVKQTFDDIAVLNNTCLTWTRSSSAARSSEVYTIFIQGRTWSTGGLLQSIMFNFSTDEVTPVLCLDLPVAGEYFVNITEPSTELSAYAHINITSDEIENSTMEQMFNETCLWWNQSLNGLQEIYKLYVHGERWSLKELFQDLLYKINSDRNISAICLDIPMDAQHPNNVTGAFSNLVDGEPIQNLTVFNETCLIWRRQFNSKELYLFFIYGCRRNEKSIAHKLIFNVTTDEKQPVVCFNLQKGINYTVDVVSAFYPQYPLQIFMLTPNSDAPLPKLKIVPAQSQLPKISFQRKDRNGPISSYQVFVIQLVQGCSFTCESLKAVTYFNNVSKTQGYVTAEFFPGDVLDHLEFSVGDRKYYGEFYNAPLESGKDYCIILRTITKMRTQTCTVMAQVEELSGSRHHMAVVLLGSLAFACFIVFMSYSLARCCNS
ncbi:sushi domain-containing protein 1 [Phyllobates terribilis]|uniref:sushi domain-containing protein 1 n=1 Tax=Phyllobates terribilis TaxID=111132 RepID=UPI003CCAE91A